MVQLTDTYLTDILSIFRKLSYQQSLKVSFQLTDIFLKKGKDRERLLIRLVTVLEIHKK